MLAETQTPGSPLSSPSHSPDSLYSNDSPLCPNSNAFEYDDELELEHEEMDTGEYEALIVAGDDEGNGDDDPSSPAWGRWPNQSSLGGPGWTPLSVHGGLRSGSIISISPRGSLSTSRRGSLPNRKLSDTTSRRGSLGLRMDSPKPRRLSAKSQNSSRRRSSVMSNGSIMDPVEEQRMRNFAGIEILARRFSELVEVIAPSPGDEEQDGMDDVAYAREMISRWSPYSTDTMTDVSEIRTAPYVPTPEVASAIPTIWSNYPLESVAREYSLNTPDMDDRLPIPSYRRRSSPRIPVEYTPPPPREPSEQIRQRARPGIVRATTDYVFPASLPVDPLETMSRPVPRRAISTPQLHSAYVKVEETVESPTTRVPALSNRNPPTGSFPLARSHPLGLSRLRESTRRTSASSDILPGPRRPSSVAERRISIVDLGIRRVSASRKPSCDQSPKTSRKSSVEPSQDAGLLKPPSRQSLTGQESRRGSAKSMASRRTSTASRKSSIVSLGEYGYLAGEIDNAIPPIPTVVKTSSVVSSSSRNESLGARRNAPASIVLPTYNFPTSPSGPLSGGSSTATPRYNPLDSFFGRNTPALVSSSCTYVDPFSSASDVSSPKTPGLHRSVLDRGRPVSSPEFMDSFPGRSNYQITSKTDNTEKIGHTSPVIETPKADNSRHSSWIQSPQFPHMSRPDSDSGEGKTRPQRHSTLLPSQMPLKSILVHRTADSHITPPPRPQAQRASTFESERDIQLLLKARHEQRSSPSRDTLESGNGSKNRPAMSRHSSFTRLFHRAKSQSPTT